MARWSVEGVGKAVELSVALQAFAATVGVGGTEGDGQLVTELGNIDGQKGWMLSLVRQVERGQTPVVQAACVVSKARAKLFFCHM